MVVWGFCNFDYNLCYKVFAAGFSQQFARDSDVTILGWQIPGQAITKRTISHSAPSL